MKQLKTSCFLKLRDLAKMKTFFTTKQMGTLTQAIVISSLDYCNALYYGCCQASIAQLQNIQNRACRLVFGLKKRDSVEEKLKSLHWLKVKERIEFKLCSLIFKAVNGVAPAYLCDLVTFVSSSSRRTSSLHLPVGSTRSQLHTNIT